jgi:general L-amino acid transport system substrate-binding protein
MPGIAALRAGGIAAALLSLLAAVTPAAAQPAADTLGAVRARGTLLCGVAPSTAGFALPDSRGVWRGIDVDFCRAVAAAVLGDANRVRFIPSTPQQRFTMLQSGEIDLLVRQTTWTLTRESQLGLAFAGINFYDGQGFLVNRALGVTSARQLEGATVCVQPGTTTELNLADYFRAQRMRFTPVVIETAEEIRAAFVAGRCDVYTTDASALASFRATQGGNAERYLLLPEIISKEPLGPAVRKGDWRWFDIVRWTTFALLTAEELGITSQTIDRFADSANPEVQRFMGRSGDLGRSLGLENDWAVRIVRQVGNYGELWERNITPLGIQRGINNLWNQGGLHYAPPMR